MTTKSGTTTPYTKEYIAKYLLINGKPADRATVNRIVNAKPRPADNVEPLYYPAFNLMR